eukprot:9487771-Karenia_brevis.AAC.1
MDHGPHSKGPFISDGVRSVALVDLPSEVSSGISDFIPNSFDSSRKFLLHRWEKIEVLQAPSKSLAGLHKSCPYIEYRRKKELPTQ